MRSVILTSLFLAFICQPVGRAADPRERLVSYQVQNRSAEELVALAEKFFAGRARLVAQNGKIIVGGPGETTNAVVALLRELDVRPAQYRVSIREAAGEESERTHIDSAFTVALSGHRAQLAKRRMTLGSGRAESGGQNYQTVNVMEGGPATLVAGDSAFRVSARPAGNGRATVSVVQITASAYVGSTSGIATELTVSEGRWQSISGSDTKNESKQSGPLNRAVERGSAQRNWQIRVESVRP